MMLLVIGLAFASSTLESTSQGADSQAQISQNGAVSSEHPICSEHGVEILKRSGATAVDATIAVLLCIGVINNFASGIGGGGFMLIRDGEGKSTVIDFRETAPSSSSKDMFNNNPKWATESALGIAVPGEVRGFAMAHQKYKGLPWEELFQGSIKLARDGFEVTEKLAVMIDKFQLDLHKSPAMRAIYFRGDGQPKKKGDWIHRPNLAATLERIAALGPDAFYKPDIAGVDEGAPQSLNIPRSINKIISDNLKEIGLSEGGMTIGDMEKYEAIERDPIYGTFMGYEVITAGSPTSGPVLIQILNTIEKAINNGDLSSDSNAVLLMHWMLESFKFGYASRMKLGDPAFVPDIEQIEKKIISRETASRLAEKIDNTQTFPPDHYMDCFAQINSAGTTHVSIFDKRINMAVSATSTVNLEWGCRIMDEKTGVLLNNEMDDFSIPNSDNSFGLPPSENNYIQAGKRPLSSSTPVILTKNGQVYLVVGAAGGSRIITATVQTILNLVIRGMTPEEAVNDCRLHHQLLPDVVIAEDRCEQAQVNGLRKLKHLVQILKPEEHPSSVNLVVFRPDIGVVAVADKRKGGKGSGY